MEKKLRVNSEIRGTSPRRSRGSELSKPPQKLRNPQNLEVCRLRVVLPPISDTVPSMLISVEVPDEIAHILRLEGPQASRRHLEILALEGYRSGKLSRGQVSQLLGMGFDETEAFLKAHDADMGVTAEELEQDSASLRAFLAR
jgi:predicted HTH domain antitoxin